jgi:transposase
MDIITQNACHKQRMMKYLETHTAIQTSKQYKDSRKTVYKWKKRYNGSIESLRERSHRPKNSPRAHTDEEKALIKKW